MVAGRRDVIDEEIKHPSLSESRRPLALWPVQDVSGNLFGCYLVEDGDGQSFLQTMRGPGCPGWTNEALLLVVLDRLRQWQAESEPKCLENELAITFLDRALAELHRRELRKMESEDGGGARS